MNKFKNYVAPELKVFSMYQSDVVRTSQVDVYASDGYGDGWKDGSLVN